ncbi:MAG: hypothetical protein ACKVSF_12370 [Alphaproteobacteria bacterium]
MLEALGLARPGAVAHAERRRLQYRVKIALEQGPRPGIECAAVAVAHPLGLGAIAPLGLRGLAVALELARMAVERRHRRGAFLEQSLQ